jgi:hypothetical protein
MLKFHQARWYSIRDSNPLRPEERPEALLLKPSCSVSGAVIAECTKCTAARFEFSSDACGMYTNHCTVNC